MALRRASLPRSAKTMAANLGRSMRPFASTISRPNSRSTSPYAGSPGSISLCARESASSTRKPISRSMAATALLPLAMPPVRPRRSMRISPRADSGGSSVGFQVSPAEKGGLDGVAHEHGDGHGANASGNRSESTGDVHGVGMHVAHQRRTFGMKLLEARREAAE